MDKAVTYSEVGSIPATPKWYFIKVVYGAGLASRTKKLIIKS